MGTLKREEVIPGADIPSQYIRINRGKGIEARITIYSFIDSDTKQRITFCPAFNITGYGSTREKADVMFDFNLDQFYEYLYALSPDKQNSELIKLGWKRDKFKNKNYSNAFIDIDGELQNFNIQEGSLKFETLTVEAN